MVKNKIIKIVSISFFWIATAVFLLGILITFYPGAEKNYYILVATLYLIPIAASDKKWIKIVSITLLIVSCFFIYEGHKRGAQYERYKEYLKRNPDNALDYYNFLEKEAMDSLTKNRKP